MNPHETYPGTAFLPAWFGAGALVAVLSFFGVEAPTDKLGEDGQPPTASPTKETTVERWTIPSIHGLAGFPASMWDEPFQFAEHERIDKLDEESELAHLLRSKLNRGPQQKLMLLFVTAPSEANLLETQRRRRHAVELALANQDFSLAYPDRMSYRRVEYEFHYSARGVSLKPRDGKSKETRSKTPLVETRAVALPTKLYERNDDGSLILITWVPDQCLGQRPISTLRCLLRDLREFHQQAAFCFLGPSWSNNLSTLIKDASKCSPEEAQAITDWKYGSVLCNSLCTAPDGRLGISSDKEKFIPLGSERQPKDDAQPESTKQWKLIHTIGSDERLIDVLQHELDIRGVWPSPSSSSNMVLFAEQGATTYVESLQNSLQQVGESAPLIVIPYLKGIAAGQIDHEGKTLVTGDAYVEDYLDRSLVELKAPSSFRSIKPNAVRLVGVIGSRWEDKNLILQKARKVFPVATFFTTELDARYSLPDCIGHTRNLIVASHYGLTVSGQNGVFPKIADTPAFRDGYQTSIFVGASVLCHAFDQNRLNKDDCIKTFNDVNQDLFDLVGRQASTFDASTMLWPTVFEVGSHHAVQMPDARDSNDFLALRQPTGSLSIHHRSWRLAIVAVGLLMVGLAFNFLASYSADAENLKAEIVKELKATTGAFLRFFGFGSKQQDGHNMGWALAVSLLLGVVILVFMVVSDASPESEPVLFTEGISIWPSIWGLYAVIVFGLFEFRDMFAHDDSAVARRRREYDQTACKLAATILIGFYVISFIESGWITPPCRDWLIRGMAGVLLFVATACVLLVTCRCLLFSLGARKRITKKRSGVETKNDLAEDLVASCYEVMELSVDASRDLIGPTILGILFIAARWRGWDAWGLDRSWYVLFGVPIATCILAALIVRMTARDYRAAVLDVLHKRRYDLLTGRSRERGTRTRTPERKELLDGSIDEVAQLSRGPFGPISRDYLLGAVVLVIAVVVTGPIGSLLNSLMAVVS